MILLNFFALKPCSEHKRSSKTGSGRQRLGCRWGEKQRQKTGLYKENQGEPMREGQARSSKAFLELLLELLEKCFFCPGSNNPGAAGGQVAKDVAIQKVLD